MYVSRLSDEDRKNIASLIVDSKYHSFVKLTANLKAQWLQQMFYKKCDDEDVKRGGIMILQMLERQIEDEFNQKYTQRMNADMQEETLDGLGY